MVYSPVKFSGKHAQDIISLVIHANRTVSKNLVRVLDNVKNEEHVTTISGDVPWRAYDEDVTEAKLVTYAADSTLAFSDQTVTPKKIMAMDKFLLDQLRNTRFSEDMKAGAANITSDSFQQAVITYLTPRLGKSYEKMFYTSVTAATKAAVAGGAASASQKAWVAAQTAGLVDGIIVQMIVSGAVSAVVATTVTAANIVAEYTKLYNGIPTVVAGLTDTRIFAPETDYALILQANQNATYRDIFTVSGNGIDEAEVRFLGVQIEFVPLAGAGQTPRFAGRAGANGDFALATDLLSDANGFEIGRVNNVGDALFGKAVASLDAAVLLPQQKVLYI